MYGVEQEDKMSKIKYNKDTLDKFSLKELQKICTYYDIQFAPSWSKARLVKEILDYSPPSLIRKTYNFEHEPLAFQEPHTSQENVIIRKSVRIQRIEDRKEK